MWRLLVVLFFWSVGGVCLGTPDTASATQENSWLESPITKRSEIKRQSPDDEKTCGGRTLLLEVKGETVAKEGCVFGDPQGVKVARYRQVNSQFAYAIAFASDTSFMKINNLCTGVTSCVYSQIDDTFFMQYPNGNGYSLKYIKNFTRHLRQEANYFRFESGEIGTILTANQMPALVGSIGVSSNGKWVAVELKELGFAIFDVKQQKYKRFAFVDSNASTNGQAHELTISDDGRWVAVVGYSPGVYIYEINDDCGDFLEVGHSNGAASQTIACNVRILSSNVLGAGFVSVHSPRFSKDGKKLLLEVRKANDTFTVTLSSQQIEAISPFYIAFGDSFSSGEGELSDSYYIAETNTPTNRCHVSSRSYPYILQTMWEIEALNMACSGSQIPGVRQASQAFLDSKSSHTPSVLSIGIGGNDVDFMGKLKSCIGFGTCEWARPEKRTATAEEIKALFPKLVEIINELKSEYSPAGLFLVGYPGVINTSLSATCTVLINSLLNEEERRYMGESIHYLNKVLHAAANYTKVTFADIENSYEGERLCENKEEAMNGVRYGDDIAPIPFLNNFKLIGAESFHPTPRGHQLAATKINTQLEPFWRSYECEGCVYNASQLEPSSYWYQSGGSSTPPARQIAQKFLPTEPLESILNVAIKFLPNFFSPNSKVTFELHSDVKQLGSFTSNSEGALEGTLMLPNGVEGYHTVHAYGTSRSGEQIDVYQIVYMDTTGIGNAKDTATKETIAMEIDPLPYSTILASYDTSQKFHSEPKSDVSIAHASKEQGVKWQIAVGIRGCLLVVVLSFIILKIRQSLSGP